MEQCSFFYDYLSLGSKKFYFDEIYDGSNTSNVCKEQKEPVPLKKQMTNHRMNVRKGENIESACNKSYEG